MDPAEHPIANIVGRVVPAIFGMIGVTVLVFLWSAPFGEFGSPPLFFRVFASFIALVFMTVGFGGAIAGPAAVRRREGGKRSKRNRRELAKTAERSNPGIGYGCPNCGGGLGADADVSPSGDVKCTFCAQWFNIHQAD